MLITAFADRLTPEEREAVRCARLWVTVAIDVATRCILAMRFSTRAPSHESSLAALEMVVSNKTHISKLIGAENEWIEALVPEEIVVDAGSAFTDFRFESAVASLGCTLSHPPAGDAAARGTIESFFRTCGKQFLHYFEGRTFSNVVEKGAYNSDGRVVLNIDEVNRYLVRAVLDIYHGQIHGGMGMTPADAWDEKVGEHGIIMPLSKRERRQIFGIELNRSIGDSGVRFFGIHYVDASLQRMRRCQEALPGTKSAKVAIRVDRFDLKTISYWNGEDWIEAIAGDHIPQDLSVWEWIGANRVYDGHYGALAERRMSTLLNTVNFLRERGAAAAARAELSTDIPTAEQLEKIEREHFGKDIVLDMIASVPSLAPLAIAHDPLSVGIPAFGHLVKNKKEMNAEVERKPKPKLESGFASAFLSSDGDDVIVED
jgi:putative transposase